MKANLWLFAVLLSLSARFAHGGTTFTTLFSFRRDDTNGVNPAAGLVQGQDGFFYGTTSGGLSAGYSGSGPPAIRGTVFKISSLGVFTTIGSFNGINGDSPLAALTEFTGGDFYGTTSSGGANGYGTIFRVTPKGSLTTLTSFVGLNGTTGWGPRGGLVPGADGNFYGTAYRSGRSDYGTVFRTTTNGTITKLFSFAGTNGAYPRGELVQGADGSFYGTTSFGGQAKGPVPPDDAGYGTVFKITTNGSFTTLLSFSGTNGTHPYAGVVQGKDGTLYGTTRWGGAYNHGAVFQISPNGKLSTLVAFNGTNGAWPEAPLLQARNGDLYGTTLTGGLGYNGVPRYGNGTIFEISPNGVLKTLVFFNGTNGLNPSGGLVEGADADLYGTTQYGGADNAGTIYRFSVKN